MGFALERLDQRLIDLLRAIRNQRTQQSENRPAGRVPGIARGTLYPLGHPYHRAVVSEKHGELVDIHPDEVRAFVVSHSTPTGRRLSSRATSILRAHCLSSSNTSAACRLKARRRTGPPRPPLAGARRDPHRARRPGGGALGDDRLGHSGEICAGRLDLDLVGELLAGTQAGWLRWRLVTKLGVATEVSAHQFSRDLGSEFVVTAQAAPANTSAELISAIDEVLAGLRG